MQGSLAGLLQESASVYRLVEFIERFCNDQQSSRSYAFATDLFLRDIASLAGGTKKYLLRLAEFATEAQWATGQIAARAVIDATASLREVMPLWLIHSRTQALVFERQTVSLDLATGMRALKLSGMENTALTRMDQNLRPTQTK